MDIARFRQECKQIDEGEIDDFSLEVSEYFYYEVDLFSSYCMRKENKEKIEERMHFLERAYEDYTHLIKGMKVVRDLLMFDPPNVIDLVKGMGRKSLK